MERELFEEITVGADDGLSYNMKLTYYLLTDNVSEKYCDLKVYGAEIDKVATYDNGSDEKEKKIMKNLFFKKEEAEGFLKTISVGKVTPMGLKYAVSEHIDRRMGIIQ